MKLDLELTEFHTLWTWAIIYIAVLSTIVYTIDYVFFILKRFKKRKSKNAKIQRNIH